MGARANDAAARSERARMIGLFRYRLIREAADPGLSTRARGRMVRAVAAAEHLDPTGRQVRVSRDTLDRWIRAWRRGGFDALVPSPRQSAPRLPVEVVEMAVALKRENPERTGAQVRRILASQMGWAPGERTLQRWFADDPTITDLVSAGSVGPVFGRFEALRPNELWTGDALHGPSVAGRKTYLFAFLDDHCAPRGASLYPRRSRDELGGRFVGPMANLDPKGEGDNSMPGKQRSCSGV